MNPRWIKQHLVGIIAGVVFVAVLAGIVVLERQAAGRKDLVESELEQQQRELQRLRNLDPTPSPENIEAFRHDREQLQHLHGDLQKGAVRPPVAVPDLRRPIEFSQLMREIVGRRTADASRNNVLIEENFAFGFSRYDTDFPCRHPSVKAEECQQLLALLAKQLLVVDKLSTLLIQSKVDAIARVRRTEVEPGPAGEDALAAPINNDPKAYYKTYPFELEFVCEPESLRAFLNSLTQSDWFFAVRSLKVESLTSAGGGTGVAPLLAPRPGATVDRTADTTRGERRLLNVTVRVDLVEFEPPAKEGERKS